MTGKFLCAFLEVATLIRISGVASPVHTPTTQWTTGRDRWQVQEVDSEWFGKVFCQSRSKSDILK